MDSKHWDGPVELFYWNGQISIRDRNKKLVCHLSGNGSMADVKKIKEKIGPAIVEMMNGYGFSITSTDKAPDSDMKPIEALFPPKRRGRPPKVAA